jgi:hypothetical protein
MRLASGRQLGKADRFAPHCPEVPMRWLTLAAFLLLAPAGLAAEVGKIAGVRGEVALIHAGERRIATAGDALAPGDRVVTGPRGMALLQLRGGLTLTVARDTELVVGGAGAGTARATMAGWLEVLEGLVRAVLSAPAVAPEVRVQTPLAVTSVRSTEWSVEHDPTDVHTAVFCRTGAVAVTAAGATVTLGPGDGSDIRGDGAAPGAPAAWGAPRVADTLARSTFATP